jgi:hypothetical protein
MAFYNKDLDFIAFTTNLIKQVDSIASDGKTGTVELFKQESRVDAFYRAIGLPGVITTPGFSPLRKNNGNLFPSIHDQNILGGLVIREGQFYRNSILQLPINSGTINSLFDLNKSNILDSIQESSNTTYYGYKLQLYPMCVDANLDIFPESKRVGGAFMTDEQLQDDSSNDKTSYRRPLIETIIILRLGSLGAINSSKLSGVSSTVFSDFLGISDNIQQNLVLTLSNVVVEMANIKKNIDAIRKKTSDQIIPSTTPSQNPDIQLDPNNNPAELDIQQAQQNQYIELKSAQLALFNYDDTVYSSITGTSTRNLKDAVLASNLIDVLFSDAGQIANSADDTNSQKSKTVVKMKQTFRDLDSILGTFSGLSGTDAIAVILALFQIDFAYLIALINAEARQRLYALTGVDCRSSVSTSGVPNFQLNDDQSVQTAMFVLFNQVSSIITTLAGDIKTSKHKVQKDLYGKPIGA